MLVSQHCNCVSVNRVRLKASKPNPTLLQADVGFLVSNYSSVGKSSQLVNVSWIYSHTVKRRPNPSTLQNITVDERRSNSDSSFEI